MLAALLIIIAIFLIALAFYQWATLNNDYFEKRNMKYMKPKFLLGYAGEFFFGRRTLAAFAQELYQAFPDEPWVMKFN